MAEAPEGDLDVLGDGVPRYRLDPRARELAEFEGTSWWLRTAPQSPFVRGPICSRLTADSGRITLSGRRLVTTDALGAQTRITLADEDLIGAYRSYFGLELDRAPDSDQSLSFGW